MRRILKYLALVLGTLLLFLGVAAVYNLTAPVPTFPVDIPDTVSILYNDTNTLIRGEKLVSMACVDCHLNDDGKLAGQRFPEDDFGELYSANITNHPTTGVGRYSDQELVHLLRTGLRPDGSQLIPIMPRLNKVSDEDIGAIIAFLRSDNPMVEPVDQQWPRLKPGFLAKALLRLAFKPAEMPREPVVAPPLIDLPAHGEYLANALFDCFKCHSASFTSNNDAVPSLSEGYYEGGNPLSDMKGNLVPSANLTPHPEHGLGGWSLRDFSLAVRSGQRPDGQVLSDAMPRYAGLTDEELAAIWAFLQKLPVSDNVPRVATVE
ncbi:cytochrome c [Neolewinella persica]|uniref:cytochrome c n=1 Tax=Neolewinella persica TaxID=70998 RepID=UPI000380B0ED|nr:cytochrome c [Neolewinella persica]